MLSDQMRQTPFAVFQTIAVTVGIVCVCWYVSQHPWTMLQTIGLALAAPGLVLLATARIQLGRSFAIKAKAHELVTHGLYSKIRNPIYVFSALFLAGMLLLVGRPRWLLILLIVVPMQIARARKEANILEAKFGDAYREYRRKTWF